MTEQAPVVATEPDTELKIEHKELHVAPDLRSLTPNIVACYNVYHEEEMIESSIASVAPYVDKVLVVFGRFLGPAEVSGDPTKAIGFPEIPGPDPTIEIVEAMKASFPNIVTVDHSKEPFPSQWDVGGGRHWFLREGMLQGGLRIGDWMLLIDGDEVIEPHNPLEWERLKNPLAFETCYSLPVWIKTHGEWGPQAHRGWTNRFHRMLTYRMRWAYPEGGIIYNDEIEGIGRWNEILEDPLYPKMWMTLHHYPRVKCIHRDVADKAYTDDWVRKNKIFSDAEMF